MCWGLVWSSGTFHCASLHSLRLNHYSTYYGWSGCYHGNRPCSIQFLWEIFPLTEQKINKILCLKCQVLNINFLFIEHHIHIHAAVPNINTAVITWSYVITCDYLILCYYMWLPDRTCDYLILPVIMWAYLIFLTSGESFTAQKTAAWTNMEQNLTFNHKFSFNTASDCSWAPSSVPSDSLFRSSNTFLQFICRHYISQQDSHL